MKQDFALKGLVREILKIVQQIAPGNSVELRIPPHSAIQCVSGSVHRRGTPPNVVEMSGDTLIDLINDPTNWDEFCNKGRISASGTNSNLMDLFVKVSRLYSISKLGR